MRVGDDNEELVAEPHGVERAELLGPLVERELGVVGQEGQRAYERPCQPRTYCNGFNGLLTNNGEADRASRKVAESLDLHLAEDMEKSIDQRDNARERSESAEFVDGSRHVESASKSVCKRRLVR